MTGPELMSEGGREGRERRTAEQHERLSGYDQRWPRLPNGHAAGQDDLERIDAEQELEELEREQEDDRWKGPRTEDG